MNCPNCGMELEENSKFCPKCGSMIADIAKIAKNTDEIKKK